MRLTALATLFLLLPGCGGRRAEPAGAADSSAEPAMVLHTATPAPSPTAALAEGEATPPPDMTFEEDGDIYFSEAYKAGFIPRIFSFDHPPRVLIYHTHAREAFRTEAGPAVTAVPRAAEEDPAATPAPGADAPTRSTDQSQNVVRIGNLLAEALAARGFTVLHDNSDVEEPSLSTAYARSRKVMEKYRDIDLYIDLHRNAANAQRAKNDVVVLDGKRTARLFFVVGTGLKADTEAGELPGWKRNYILALSLYERLRAVDARLVKENRMKQGTYNQDLGLSLLCEIGHNANLLSDAENTVPYLADALAQVIRF